MKRHILAAIGFLYFLVLAPLAGATTFTWDGSSSSDWFDGNNWDQSAVPTNGADVVINTGSVLLSNDTATLGSFTITNATLTSTNWTTTLSATTVTIQNGGIVTLPAAFTDAGMSNRVHIVCTNLTVETGGRIDGDGGGYRIAEGPGKGNQNGSNNNSGGGHGGRGGDEAGGAGGVTYDSATAPLSPGSGGGRWTSSPLTNGEGGGAVRIDASGAVTVDGTITADGQTGNPYDGGGSGGAVYITCNTFGGTSGIISADGGDGGAWYGGGGGGGGRIAVSYTSVSGTPSIQFSAEAGAKYTELAAGMGTLSLPDTALVTAPFNDFDNVRLVIPSFSSWTSDSLAVAGSLSFGDSAFTLTVSNNLTISNSAWLVVGGTAYSSGQVGGLSSTGAIATVSIGGSAVLNGGALSIGGLDQEGTAALNVTGNLTLTNGATLYIYSGVTNAAVSNGATMAIQGDVAIASNSWLYPYSHSTNGGTPILTMGDLTIAEGGGINANGAGFRSESAIAYGPGKGISAGSRGGGGGYGGAGGAGDNPSATGGPAYGSTDAPVEAGSAGAYGHSPLPGLAWGGGCIRIEAANVIVNGTITADGQDSASGYGGGGSGGGIFIDSDTFAGGSNAVLRADGGDGGAYAGGAGGGRIAIWYAVPDNYEQKIMDGDLQNVLAAESYSPFTGTVSVSNGTGYEDGQVGSIVFLTVVPPSGPSFLFW